jgi:hypothetical protein
MSVFLRNIDGKEVEVSSKEHKRLERKYVKHVYPLSPWYNVKGIVKTWSDQPCYGQYDVLLYSEEGLPVSTLKCDWEGQFNKFKELEGSFIKKILARKSIDRMGQTVYEPHMVFMLSQNDAKRIAHSYLLVLKNAVGVSTPYLRDENGRKVYKAPLLVQSDHRIIDMVGVAEITVDSYSREILNIPTQEEIDTKVKEITSRSD